MRARARPHVGMRVRVSRIGCFFRCIVSYSVHVSRALYEGQFRGHKQGSLTDDKRHLGSRGIRQDEAVELLDALFLADDSNRIRNLRSMRRAKNISAFQYQKDN